VSAHPAPILVDEVQYAPKLFRHLKVEIDHHREACGRFILIGSQKLALMREVSDSLAGRCGVLELEALSINDLGNVFEEQESKAGIGEVLTRGFMPQLWKDIALPPIDFFRSFSATYLERESVAIFSLQSKDEQTTRNSVCSR